MIKAIECAQKRRLKTIGWSGKKGGKLAEVADQSLLVPSDDVQRIQEAHITIGHIIIGLIEREIGGHG